jgi:nitrogen regulatory protein P-II 1
VVCSDDKAELVVSTIMQTAKTGKIGDGKVFVLSVDEAYRIRTEESNEKAV